MKKISVILLSLLIFTKSYACVSCIFLIGAAGGYVFNSAIHSKPDVVVINKDQDECRKEVYHYDSRGNITSKECIK